MRSLVVIILVGMLLSLCVQGIGPEEIKQKAIESSKNIKTCKFKMIINTKLYLGNESSEMISNAKGIYDFANKRMYMKMVTKMKGLQIVSESYIVNDTMYVKMISPNGTYKWIKTKVENDPWNRSNQIRRQIDLLRISEVKRLPDETVNGTECYVLELKPNLDKFAELMANYGQKGIQNVSILKRVLKDIRIKEWIAKDTFYPVKSQMVTVMEMPMFIGSIRQVTNTTIELYDINKPINVVLPKEALNATPIHVE